MEPIILCKRKHGFHTSNGPDTAPKGVVEEGKYYAGTEGVTSDRTKRFQPENKPLIFNLSKDKGWDQSRFDIIHILKP